jgi:hypothetical protein
MEVTPRLGLRTLIPGQAQKEITVNESWQILDAVVAGTVEEPARLDPPTAPAVGTSYIIGRGATGAWAGQDDAIAAFTVGGWRMIAPVDGLCLLVRSTGETLRYANGGWSIMLGAPQPAISNVAGGTTVDAESRAAISAILGTLRAHGLISP